MGSIKPTKTKRGYFGKVESSLNEKLVNVEWGESKVSDLFSVNTSNKRFDANKVKISKDKRGYPYIVRQSTNNGRRGYIQESPEYLNEKNTIAFGQDTATMFYQSEPYFTGDKIKILKPKFKEFNQDNAQFFLTAMEKSFSSFSWGSSSFNVKIIENQIVKIPVKDGKPDFEFMESFIAELEAERIEELEAYLEVTGLSDCELTEDEQKALDDFTNDDVEWSEFSYQSLFSNIQQGKRLKKDDQKSGNLPFVMSGVTNTGVVNHIANSVFRFPKNSITVDIFGNAFYRDYDFGAGDDTGVYWNSEKEHSKNAMLFIASSLERSIFGKFSYGKKLRSSQSLNFQAMLPSMNNKPDYSSMERFISAIQKIVIKDVVEYADTKIEAHKEVIHS